MSSPLRYAVLNPLRRKARSVYAMIGIVISVSLVVAIVSASRGVQQGFESLLLNYRGDLIVFRDGAAGMSGSTLPIGWTETIRSVEGVAAANPYSLKVNTIGVQNPFRPAPVSEESDEGESAEGGDSAEDASEDPLAGIPPYARQLLMALPRDRQARLAAELRRSFDGAFPSPMALILGFPPDAFIFDRIELVDPAELGLPAAARSARFSSNTAREMIIGRQLFDLLRGAVDAAPQAMDRRINVELSRLVESGVLRQTEADTVRMFFQGDRVEQLIAPLIDPAWGVPVPSIAEEPFTIVGVFDTGGFMDTQVMIPMGTYREIFNEPDTINAYLIEAEDGEDVTALASRVRDALELGPAAGEPIDVLDPRRLVERFDDEYQVLQTMILAIGILAGLGGAVGVLNTMASNIQERTREIGLLRAVGWSRGQIIRSILVEGTLISFAGGVLGVAVGILELFIAESILRVNPIPNGFEWEIGLGGLATAILLGIVGSAIPAWRASTLSPVEAIRVE